MSGKDDFLNPDAGMAVGMENNGMVLDLDAIDESSLEFKALPVGVYEAVVENVEFKTSQSGNPMLSWTFAITGGEYDKRKQFTHHVLNNEFGIARLKRTLVRLMPEYPLSGFNPSTFAANGEAIGKPCRLKLKQRKYDGKLTNDVKEVLEPDSGAFL